MIYFLRNPRTGLIKIGRTSYFASRYGELCHETGGPLELLGTMPEEDWQESGLHFAFRKYRTVGEWFQDHAHLRKFIAKYAQADAPGIDRARCRTMVPVDRTIAMQAKKVAAERMIPLDDYLNGVLRATVDADARKIGWPA